MPSFQENNQSLIGVLYDLVAEHETFTHVRSVFKDKWYNFIVPKVLPGMLDWQSVLELTHAEEKGGYALSYYVPERFRSAYKEYFFKRGKENESGSDFQVRAQNIRIDETPGELILVDNKILGNLLKMVEICFPDWDNNQEYTKYFYELQDKASHVVINNYLYRLNGNDVGFCGYVGSLQENLAYIHNTGVLPQYRRQGHFSNMIHHLMNKALESKIEYSFALVDKDGASYLALKKLGFVTKNKYYLFNI
jgi:hypothetical protein